MSMIGKGSRRRSVLAYGNNETDVATAALMLNCSREKVYKLIEKKLIEATPNGICRSRRRKPRLKVKISSLRAYAKEVGATIHKIGRKPRTADRLQDKGLTKFLTEEFGARLKAANIVLIRSKWEEIYVWVKYRTPIRHRERILKFSRPIESSERGLKNRAFTISIDEEELMIDYRAGEESRKTICSDLERIIISALAEVKKDIEARKPQLSTANKTLKSKPRNKSKINSVS